MKRVHQHPAEPAASKPAKRSPRPPQNDTANDAAAREPHPLTLVFTGLQRATALHLPAWFPLWLLTLIATGVLFALVLTLFTPQYNTRDDIGMMLLSSGRVIALEPTEYLMFTNIVLGLLLKTLYASLPEISWYAWYLIAALFCAHWALLWVVLKRHQSWLGLLLFALYFWMLGAFMLLNLQFTMVSFIVGVAAIALFAGVPDDSVAEMLHDGNAPRSGSWKRYLQPSALFGAVLLWVSCLIRVESFLLALFCTVPVVAVGVLWELTVQRQSGRQKNKKRLHNAGQASEVRFVPMQTLLARLPVFVVALLLCAASQMYHHHRYSAPEAQWYGMNVLEHNRICSEFLDFRLPRRHIVALDRAGLDAMIQQAKLTVMDFEMLQNWFYLDSSLYSTSTLKHLKNLFIEQEQRYREPDEQAKEDDYQQRLRATMRERLWHTFSDASAQSAGVMAAFALLLIVPVGFQSLLSLLATGLTVGCAAWYIHYQTLLRDAPERLTVPLVAFIGLAVLIFGASVHSSRNAASPSVTLRFAPLRLVGALALMLVVFMASVQSGERWQAISDETQRNSAELTTIADSLAPSSSKLYVIWADGFPLDYIAPLASSASLAWTKSFHAVWLSWCQTMPSTTAMLKHFGIHNLYRAIAERDNVYVLFSVNQLRAPDLMYHLRYQTYMDSHYSDLQLQTTDLPMRSLQPVPERDEDLNPYRTYVEVKFKTTLKATTPPVPPAAGQSRNP
jgi:hypothetical protein